MGSNGIVWDGNYAKRKWLWHVIKKHSADLHVQHTGNHSLFTRDIFFYII